MEKEINECTSTTPCECGEKKKPSKFKTVLMYFGTFAASFAAGVCLADPVKKGVKKLFNRRGSEQPQQHQQQRNSYGK
jgi:hypothetical protein